MSNKRVAVGGGGLPLSLRLPYEIPEFSKAKMTLGVQAHFRLHTGTLAEITKYLSLCHISLSATMIQKL